MDLEALRKRLADLETEVGRYSAHLNMLAGRKEELKFLMEELQKPAVDAGANDHGGAVIAQVE